MEEASVVSDLDLHVDLKQPQQLPQAQVLKVCRCDSINLPKDAKAPHFQTGNSVTRVHGIF